MFVKMGQAFIKIYQDLSGIFQPLSGSSIGYNTGFNVEGADLSTIFESVVGGQSITFNTGFIASNGQDLSAIFAAYNTSTWSELGSLTLSAPLLSLTIDANNNVYAGGFNYLSSTTNHILVFYNGSTWSQFGTNGISTSIASVAYNPVNGKIYAGSSSSGNTSAVFSVCDSLSSSW